MNQNPYKYVGPLDPDKDNLICVPRAKEIDGLIIGINRGDYWAILGPRQVGKTTLLLQLKLKFPDAHYIYFNFEVPPAKEENLYRLLKKELMNEIGIEKTKTTDDHSQDESPSYLFLEFLKECTPNHDTKKIIFLFDEIDGLPFLGNFLRVWRNLYHERFHKKSLYRYAVIITGSVDLLAKSIGPNSPYNIAEKLEIKDFSDEESAVLIEEPMKQLNITMEPGAQKYLLSQVSGHPQLLQHLCHLLVETGINKEKPLTIKEVDKAIEELFKSNSTLDILKQHLKNDRELTGLVKEILKGEKRKYYPYKDFSFSGVGPIIDVDNDCSIRNKIFEKFLEHLPGISTEDNFQGKTEKLMDWNISTKSEYQPVSPKIFELEKGLEDFDTFFVYNILDKEMVETIGKKLAHRGINPCHEPLNLIPGRSIQDEINRIMTRVKSLVVFIGAGKTVPWEENPNSRIITQAVQRKIPVIPVILPNVEKEPELPSFLRNRKWLKFEKDIDDVTVLDDLELGITGEKPNKGNK